MRKIYSLVLTVAALLIGTNIWATDVNDEAGLRSAIATAVASHGTADIRLTGDVTVASPIQIYAPKAIYDADPNDATASTITIDLNNHKITTSTAFYLFEFYKGTLNITGTGTIESTNTTSNSSVFGIFGSPNSTATNWTNLTIGANVNIVSTGQNAITIDGFCAKDAYSYAFQSGLVMDYCTNADYIKATGSVSTSPLINYDVIGYATSFPKYNTTQYSTTMHPTSKETVPYYKLSTYEAFAYGANVIINGYVYGQKYGIKINGYLRSNTGNIPTVLVSSTAEIACPPTTNGTTAIYSSGYGHFVINGYVHGNIGVYVKSGDVDIKDAVIKSENPTTNTIVGTTSGIDGGAGNAIVVESNSSYAGGQDVTISGDSEVTGNGGYAIVEKNTTAEDKTEKITIEGGTLNGGDMGAVAVVDNGKTTVYSGNITGDVSVGDESNKLNDLLPSDTHTTQVTVGDKTVTVVSEGEPPVTKTTLSDIVTAYNTWVSGGRVGDAPSVKATGTLGDLEADMELKELEINESTSQNLTIKSNVTLKVGKVILGSNAVVTIEPGAKLIITGDEGIYSLKNENIVIQANASTQATFVIGNDVVSNRQPHATVQYVLEVTSPSTSQAKWKRFTSPLVNVEGAPTVSPTATTYVKCLNLETGSWDNLAHWSDLRPFSACAITKTTSGNVTYSFKGRTMGNVVDSIRLQSGSWSYYGNSFTAPISAKALVTKFANTHEADATIYYWTLESQGYHYANLAKFEGDWEGLDEESDINIPMMGFFVVRNQAAAGTRLNIDYAKTVFGYAVDPTNEDYNIPAAAPARLKGTISGRVRMTLSSESGSEDKVYLLENASKYSADYDNGYDAVKLMNSDLNIYVAEEEMNYAMLATDNMMGAIISIQTSEDLNYTLTFDKVAGEEYALRDNQTNTVIMINEGATYNFTAQPNATLEGRFQIVSRQEMPTEVETIEETVAPKAIYTIMGQYVGETTDWNNLPAGVYVVDGVKVIK